MFSLPRFQFRSGLRALLLLGATLMITVCGGGGTDEATCEITAVTVQPSQVTLTLGETTTLTAQVTSSNCTPAPVVTWNSSNPGLVSIQANGNQVDVTGDGLTALRSDLAAARVPVTISAGAGTPVQTGSSQVTVVPAPAIALNTPSLSFTAVEGAPSPAAQVVTITNSGGGLLTGLGVGTITYGAGATGWVPAPLLSSTTANPSATLTIQPTTGALAAGIYTATVPVTSTSASNSPQNITVTFTVISATPVIALSANALTFNTTVGGADPASQAITITNSGSATLSGLAVGTITYGAGATGWLQAPGLSSTTADPSATITLQPVTGALAVGTHTATVPVTSAVASNSPQNITVTFNVAPAPAIALSSASLTFNASAGGANPASQAVTISNSGGGTLSGLGTGTITYGPGATGWLQAPGLSSTTANPTATLTIQPVTAGLAAGTYTATVPVTSSVASNSPQDITVTFNVGSSISVAAFLGNNQTGLLGFALNIRPAVRLTDGGVPVSNTSVTFDVVTGGGGVTGATVNTDANGVAQVGSWVLGGAPGPNTMTGTVTGPGIAGNPVTFTAIGATANYNITIQNVGPAFTAPVQAAFNAAVTKWQQVIYQDLADVTNFSTTAGSCGTGSPAIGPLTIDDVRIFARIDSIDGPSGTLGQAGPCFVRSAGRLTVLGLMTFDSADVAGLIAAGSFNSVILHEMGHVLGFGSLWTQSLFNCLQDLSSAVAVLDTYFSCLSARAMFDSIGGTTYTGGNKVPVENCGPASPAGCGAGTVNSHWREPTFINELMTGFLNGGQLNPLSRLSAAAMEDLGYGVNYAGSDAYTQVFSLLAGPSRQTLIPLGDDVYRGPIRVVDRNGRVVGVIQPR